MSTIYEKIKASQEAKSPNKYNADLVQGAANSAPTFQSYSTDPNSNAAKKDPAPVETKEENKDPNNVDEVVNTEEDVKTPDAPVSPVKATKDEITKSMGKGFVKDEFGDVTETTTGEKGSGGYEGATVGWDEGFKKWQSRGNTGSMDDFKQEASDWYDKQKTPGTEKKTYSVTPNQEETSETTPGTKSNYNMSYKNALSAKMSEGVQRRDAKQDLRQFNNDSKRFDKRGFLGLGKKGSDKINPSTGEKFASATEYADFKAGKSGRRDETTGVLDSDAEYQQKLNSRRGVDKASVTTKSSQKEQYDETKHGKKEDITYEDSEKTIENTAEVVENDKEDAAPKYKASPNKFGLKKKSGALKNFKYKK